MEKKCDLCNYDAYKKILITCEATEQSIVRRAPRIPMVPLPDPWGSVDGSFDDWHIGARNM
jgi:hypothetical protein